MVYVLAIIGMICWGIAPIFVKIGLKDTDPLVGLCIRTLFTAGVILSIMIANGSIHELKNVSSRTFLLLIAEAIFATLIGDFSYFLALKRGSVSVVTLIMSSSPLITILFSACFLGEKITMARVFGAGLIITGITFLF